MRVSTWYGECKIIHIILNCHPRQKGGDPHGTVCESGKICRLYDKKGRQTLEAEKEYESEQEEISEMVF